MLNIDISDWKITFVDTGISSNMGKRLLKVKEFLKDEELFLANYSDGLSDLPLPVMLNDFKQQNNIVGSFMVCQPTQSFHVVSLAINGNVKTINHIGDSGLWINAGYFIFTNEIFNYINDGEELVEEPFRRLIAEDRLHAFQYNGFWASMDTFKDKPSILEYEIAKYDGELGQPNFYVPLKEEHTSKRNQIIITAFESQVSKHWFDDDTFRSLPRIRGIESANKYAEAFYSRKTILY